MHGGYWPPYITDWMNFSGPPGSWVVTNCTAYRVWRDVNRAEIWFYDPSVKRWFLSYVSELVNVSELFANPYVCDTPEDELKGIWVPKIMGFRAMEVYKGCLYAGAGGIAGIFNTSTYQPPLLIRTCNGINWEEVPTPKEMSYDTRAIEAHNGWIYVGASVPSEWDILLFPEAEFRKLRSYALVWGSPGHPNASSDWVLVANLTRDEVPSIGNTRAVSLKSFNGYLYVGTSNFLYGFELWRSRVPNPIDPVNDWIKIIDYGGGDMMNYFAGTMVVYNNTLYVGTMLWPFIVPSNESEKAKPTLRGFDIFEVYPNDTWDLLVGAYIPRRPVEGWPYDYYVNITINETNITLPIRIPRSFYPSGFGNLFNIYAWSMEVYNETFYIGTMDWTTFLYFISIEDILRILGYSEENLTQALQILIVELNETIDYLNETDLIPDEFVDLLAQIRDKLIEVVESGNVTQALDELKEWFLEYFGGTDLWKTSNGLLWIPVTLNGFNNSYNYGFRVLAIGPGSSAKLYVGTANPFFGAQMLRAPEEPAPLPPPIVGGSISMNSSTNTLLLTFLILIIGAMTMIAITRFVKYR